MPMQLQRGVFSHVTKEQVLHYSSRRIGILDRLVTTRDLLNLAVIEERLSLEQANLLIAELGEKHRYHCNKLSSHDSLPAVLIPV